MVNSRNLLSALHRLSDAHKNNPLSQCSECGGKTIEFKGNGLDSEYKICSRYKEPGHKTIEQCSEELRRERQWVNPSGRFA